MWHMSSMPSVLSERCHQGHLPSVKSVICNTSHMWHFSSVSPCHKWLLPSVVSLIIDICPQWQMHIYCYQGLPASVTYVMSGIWRNWQMSSLYNRCHNWQVSLVPFVICNISLQWIRHEWHFSSATPVFSDFCHQWYLSYVTCIINVICTWWQRSSRVSCNNSIASSEFNLFLHHHDKQLNLFLQHHDKQLNLFFLHTMINNSIYFLHHHDKQLNLFLHRHD
jgi:hypothetical protein